MKLIGPAIGKPAKGRLQSYLDLFKKILPIGTARQTPEETILNIFLRGLDNRFTMLRGLRLESVGPPFPPILVGPTGLAVLNISLAKGFYKVKEDTWWKMDESTHRFDPARPNLVRQSQDYAEKLAMILDVHGKPHPEVTPLLVLADPGVHIESSNPAIRIVLMDGLENLISSLYPASEVLPPAQVNFLSDSLELIANPDKAIPKGEGEDFFGQDLYVPEKKPPPKLPVIPIPAKLPLAGVGKKLQFTQKQWMLLAILLLFTIVVLLGTILYVLSSV